MILRTTGAWRLLAGGAAAALLLLGAGLLLPQGGRGADVPKALNEGSAATSGLKALKIGSAAASGFKALKEGSGAASGLKVQLAASNTAISKPASAHPADFVMTGGLSGWGVDASGVWKTVDGGKTWRHPAANIVPADPDAAVMPVPYTFEDKQKGWVLTAYGYHQPTLVFRTSDGGRSWKAARLPASGEWEKGYGGFISFVDDLHGYILKTSDPSLGFMQKSLFRTADGGVSWSRVGEITGSIDSYPTGMVFRNETSGWITSSNHGQEDILTFRTADGGRTWTKQKLPPPPGLKPEGYTNSYPPVFSGQGMENGVLPIEVVNGEERGMVFYTTVDGGASWKAGPLWPEIQQGRFFWLDARTGWSMRQDGVLARTADGGRSWTRVSKAQLFAEGTLIRFASADRGWIAGSGFLWSTSDGGKSWTRL
ncbi:Ycf48-like protein [compost metagenome]